MSRKSTWIGLVALSRAELPDAEQVAATLARRWPSATALVPGSTTSSMATFSWGDATCAYTLIPRPIPWSQLEGPCSTAWYWPDAAQCLANHVAHLFVTLVDEGRQSIDKAVHLTQLLASVAERAPATGIFWGAGGLVHAPGHFSQLAEQMADDYLPLFLWIDFRIEQAPNGLRLFTTGMKSLEHRELEVESFSGPPQALLEHAFNVAHYLLEKGPVVKDGDTVGLADGTQVTAQYQKSMLDGEQDVIRLEFS